MIDLQWIAGLCVALLIPMFGWVLVLERRVTNTEAENRAMRDRLDGMEARIVRSLERIEQKLDLKADRE